MISSPTKPWFLAVFNCCLIFNSSSLHGSYPLNSVVLREACGVGQVGHYAGNLLGTAAAWPPQKLGIMVNSAAKEESKWFHHVPFRFITMRTQMESTWLINPSWSKIYSNIRCEKQFCCRRWIHWQIEVVERSFGSLKAAGKQLSCEEGLKPYFSNLASFETGYPLVI